MTRQGAGGSPPGRCRQKGAWRGSWRPRSCGDRRPIAGSPRATRQRSATRSKPTGTGGRAPPRAGRGRRRLRAGPAGNRAPDAPGPPRAAPRAAWPSIALLQLVQHPRPGDDQPAARHLGHVQLPIAPLQHGCGDLRDHDRAGAGVGHDLVALGAVQKGHRPGPRLGGPTGGRGRARLPADGPGGSWLPPRGPRSPRESRLPG